MKMIVLTLMLSLGAWAQEKNVCVVEGPYNLTAIPWSQNTRPQTVQGQIGSEQVRWIVRGEERTGGYFISSTLKGRKIEWELNLRSHPQVIMGWLDEQRVILQGQNGNFSGDEACWEKPKSNF